MLVQGGPVSNTIEKSECAKELCPVTVAINIFGGKWTLQIMWTLNKNKFRFGELRRQIGGISEKILIQQLKELAEEGLVNRVQFPEVPPRVEYSLTEKGRSLLPIFNQLKKWSELHLMPSYHRKKIESKLPLIKGLN